MRVLIIFCLSSLCSHCLTAKTIGDLRTGKFYKDLDYFKLEGINELGINKKAHYPYFEIIEVTAEKRIVRYVHNEALKEEKLYERRGNYWFTVRENKENLSHSYTYEYVFNDHVVELIYLYLPKIRNGKDGVEKIPDNLTIKDHFLNSIRKTTLTQDEEYFYHNNTTRKSFEKSKIYLLPSPDLEQEMKSMKYYNVSRTTREISRNVVIVKSSTERYNMEDSRCYNLIDKWGYVHNAFWIFFFYPQIDCVN